ncbi:hypothetical protein PPACK8108_LOCUS16219 [Phakopsora pachyrhizi]|uniref:SEC7 domain-containing protein n=1 Tax=Phakopsora pachyrhizi TaxID=170000 RepID=A0AAV0B926_PHAPC|nr:hypothetical protein PPACK8108_LOCUS16219 [Phakopsora pachyrhizi]
MSKITCQGSALNIIHGEIISVTSVMRKNLRWAGTSIIASSSSSPSADHSISLSNGNDRSPSLATTSISLRNSTKNENSDANVKNLKAPSGGLMDGFSSLVTELRETEDIAKLDALTLLSPFLAVVRSNDTNGPITALALSSIDKFFTYSFIHSESPSLVMAMSQVSDAGTHCRFEASDSVSDEIVLLKILDVLQNALTGPVGYILTDEAVCQMMETVLSMCCQMRLSEMLRRSGERTMQAMVFSIFQKLKSLSPSVDDRFIPDEDAEETAGLKERLRMSTPDPLSGSIPAASSSAEKGHAKSLSMGHRSLIEEEDEPQTDEKAPLIDSEEKTPIEGEDEMKEGKAEAEEVESVVNLQPFGLPSIKELLRVLVSLLNPYDTQHTDAMRLTSMNILITIFETSGVDVGQFPSLRAIVSDELCKHLFQLARSENYNILYSSLRCMSNLMDTMRPYLKIHLELLLSYLMNRLLPQPTLTIHKLTNGHTGTIPEFEEQLDCLTWKKVDRPGGDLSIPRTSSPAPSSGSRNSVMTSQQAMIATGQVRQVMLEYLAHFARAPDFMVNLWVNFDCNVDCEDIFERLIRFLARGIYALNPAYANTQDSSQILCLDTLLAYMSHMTNRMKSAPLPSVDVPAPVLLARDKKGKRALLEGAAKFNEKPKEGLKFLESNGIIYDDLSLPRPQSLALFFKTCPRLDKKLLGDFISRPENLDVLKAFMTLFDFRGKLASDCLRELLETFRLPGESQQIARITEVFASVYVATGPKDVKDEDSAYVLSYSIIMLNTDQHNPQTEGEKMTLEDYKRNLRGVNGGDDFNPDYLKAIYESIRKREIVMPEEHSGQLGFEYAWKELQRKSKKAGLFVTCNTSIFDQAMFEASWRPIVSALSYAFTHFNDDYMIQRIIAGFQQCATLASRFQLTDVFDETVAELAQITDLVPRMSSEVNFPTFKAQLATVVLFTVGSTDGSAMRKGWLYIFEIIQSLFAHSLLPNELLSLPDFANVCTIPIRPPQGQTNPPERRADGGLLSTLSSYLLSPYASPVDGIGREITDDDIESTLCAIDCLASCHFAAVYNRILNVVRILVELADRRITKHNRIRINSDHYSPPSSPISSRGSYNYDPCSLFLLELIVSVTTHEPEALHQLWTPAFDHISKILANSTIFSPLLIERAIAGLLRLQSIAVQKENLRDQFFIALDVFRSLPQTILNSVSQSMVFGVCQIALSHSKVFRYLKKLAVGELSPGLVVENFAPFIQALNSFAGVCGQENLKSQEPNKVEEATTSRALEALNMIREAQEKIPSFLSEAPFGPTSSWASFWMPVLLAYGQQSIHGNREVRQRALAYLQRSLVAPEILLNGNIDLTVIFEREQGMPRMVELWLQILGYLDRLCIVYEAVPENLKNVLLVMHASGFLVPPHEGPSVEESHLWNATFERIDPVLNTLKTDLFPPPPPSTSVTPSQTSPTVLMNNGEDLVGDKAKT